MKYIRTKDGIYRNAGGMYDNGDLTIYLNGITKLPKDEIIAQADTIEELCDEFVVNYKGEEKPRIIYMKEFLKSLEETNITKEIHYEYLADTYIKRNLGNYYGAIWIDKGLIYVAKMNDKGELKLF